MRLHSAVMVKITGAGHAHGKADRLNGILDETDESMNEESV